MRNYLLILFAVLSLSSCTDRKEYATPAEAIVAEIHDPASKKVLVASHRGDWRNYPENSLQAIESAMRMGVDIVELDVALTADSVLVLMHDRTIDRCTTGKGKLSEITYDSLQTFYLRTAHGVRCSLDLRVPTLREALEACKGGVVINIDKGYEYYDMVLALTDELGVTDQILIKGTKPSAEVAEKFSSHSRNMMYMPIINILNPAGEKLFEDYVSSSKPQLAYEVCWDQMTPQVEKCMKRVVNSGSKLWVNSLWNSLCGGLSDDVALQTSVDDVYGKLVDMGATIIQTDRPELLLRYLRSRGLHD